MTVIVDEAEVDNYDVAGGFNNEINRHYGGSMIFWNEPDGHQWEILTVSYARQ